MKVYWPVSEDSLLAVCISNASQQKYPELEDSTQGQIYFFNSNILRDNDKPYKKIYLSIQYKWLV